MEFRWDCLYPSFQGEAGDSSRTQGIIACAAQSDWFSGWTCAPDVLEISVAFLNLQVTYSNKFSFFKKASLSCVFVTDKLLNKRNKSLTLVL